jgi:hypothetical protein
MDVKDLQELDELMVWATTRDKNNPMVTDSIDTLVAKVGDKMDKRGVLIVSMVDQDGESMRTDMTVQVTADAHPMVKLLILSAKAMIQDFFEALRDKDLQKPNPARMAVQHFVAMAKAARAMDVQAKAAEEAQDAKPEVKNEG